MPDTPSIVILKSFDYRGKPEVWSNKYHFSGTVPSSDAAWKILADALIAAEAPMFKGNVTFPGALGYVAGDNNSVFQIDYTVPPNTLATGTASVGSAQEGPGDSAFWVRWGTPDRTSKGKKIYLRKYFHGTLLDATGDFLLPAQASAAATYAGKMTDGTLPGGFKVCGPQGAVAGANKVQTAITTRTLKRRGKRP